MSSLTNRTFSGILSMSVGVGANMLINVGVLIVLARLLAPADFGVVAAATALLSFADLFSRVGMATTIVQLPTLEERHVRAAYTITLISGLLFGGLALLSAQSIERFYDIAGVANVVRSLAPTFLFIALGMVAEALLARDMQFKVLARLNFISGALVLGGVSVILAVLGFGYWSLVWGRLAQVAAQSILAIRACGQPIRFGASPQALLELTRRGIRFSVEQITNHFVAKGDLLIAGRFLGVVDLGLYSRAQYFMQRPSDWYTLVAGRVVLSSFARLQDDIARLRRAYLKGLALSSMLLMPLIVVLVYAAPALVAILLGRQWTGAIPPFMILSVAILFRAGVRVSSSLLTSLGHVGLLITTSLSYFAILLGMMWWLADFGMNGLCIAVVVANFARWVAIHSGAASRLEIGLREFLGAQRAGFVLGLVAFLVGLLAQEGLTLLPAGQRGVVLDAIIVEGAIGIVLLLLTRLRLQALWGSLGLQILDDIERTLWGLVPERLQILLLKMSGRSVQVAASAGVD